MTDDSLTELLSVLDEYVAQAAVVDDHIVGALSDIRTVQNELSKKDIQGQARADWEATYQELFAELLRFKKRIEQEQCQARRDVQPKAESKVTNQGEADVSTS
ncbi:hypothetical protein J7426_22890 [Tropicibacter sp. R16_0]|uniref:hypothetical protein n=1 Tax=Tropicibacter sp. R16_0 TaxID=2821102 RepID=UPI001ADA50EB|nr:hypothetical protein [Tropicibacter sp. R16_0]MBO9453127.1 hypothetical protein [Tropicibacter sp. R16_0]